VRPRRQGPALLCGPSTSPLGAMQAPSQVSMPLRSVALVWLTVRTWGVDWILFGLNTFAFVGVFVVVLARRFSRDEVLLTAIWPLLVVAVLISIYVRPIDSLSYYKSIEWDVRYESRAQKRLRLRLTVAYVAITAITTLTVVLLAVYQGMHKAW